MSGGVITVFPFVNRRRLVAALVLCVTAAVASVCPGRAQPVSPHPCESPKTLRFALVPAQDSLRELAYYQPVLDLLAKNTGRNVDIVLPESYSALVDALVDKRVDVAVLGPESYVIAHERDRDIEVFATYWRQSDGIQKAGPGYQSVLITKKGSRFTSIDSLKGATLALVDPASTSGAMIPAKVFPRERQLPPLQRYFHKVIFSGGHDLSALAVAEGRIDAAFVASYRLMEAVNAGKVKLADYNVLWASPQIPLDPFVRRASLCEDIKRSVADTFLTADQTELGRKYLNSIRSERIVQMVDSDYNIIRIVGK